MKASEYGGEVSSTFGGIAYAKHEDGDSDGLWSNSTDSELSAILELDEDDDDPEGDGDDIIGYIADVVEVDVPMVDMVEVLNQLNEQMCAEMPSDLSDGWPESTEDQLRELSGCASDLLGQWLTKYKLWPKFYGIDNVRPVLRKQAREARGEQEKLKQTNGG